MGAGEKGFHFRTILYQGRRLNYMTLEKKGLNFVVEHKTMNLVIQLVNRCKYN